MMMGTVSFCPNTVTESASLLFTFFLSHVDLAFLEFETFFFFFF